MKKLLSIVSLLFLVIPCVLAQKKELAQAKVNIKNGKNLQQTEQSMRKLLADSANRENEKIHLALFDAIRKQYDQGNEKLYLKQKYDTATLFTLCRKMFLTLETLDSIDARPNKKGHVRLQYREKHAAFLEKYRRNLLNGGTFFIRKQMYGDAFDMFDTYIDCARQPLFQDCGYDSIDNRLPNAAYQALYAGYKQKSHERTLKYKDLALRDSVHESYTWQYLAETYKEMGDDGKYVAALRNGFEHEREFPFFFPRLIDYYNSVGMQDSALCIVDKVLERNDSSQVYLFAKSNVLLNMGKYAESIAICDSLIMRNDSLADAYYNAGLCYANLAVETEQVSKSRTKKKQIIGLYKKALPYMERYRELAPDQKDKWAPVLYNIYLNLNMGKQFDEMDKLLRK